ncbi:zinc finger MYM-type protein 1-like [Aphis craccivora]|uniref:Zinc finger MYM-type protein 1-like n=1 Tax=Aphis craccivora TaxID=307492 RepID=A0A6G0VRP0_APHCR|nr:zinc finger MYM-type protein 1-like [Aphis craccivora]
MRSDKIFQIICNETIIFMEKSEFEFTSLLIKRDFNPDHVITEPKQEYKVKTYFMIIIDAAIVSIETRFHSTCQHLLKDISLFSTAHLKQTKKDPTTLPKDAFKTFCNLYHNFVNYEDLRTECIQYSRSFFEFDDAIGFQKTYIHGEKYTSNNDSEHESEENSDSYRNEDEGKNMYVHKHKNLGTLLNMLQVCQKAGLKNVFPCHYDALHIACTLLVASTTPERTFSKLRTTISQDRLEQLLLMSCESDIKIDNGQVIDTFFNCSSVLKKHLL